MIKLDDKGCIDNEKTSLSELEKYYAARILEEFVSEGGRGLRMTLHEAMWAAMDWAREYDKRKNSSGQSGA